MATKFKIKKGDSVKIIAGDDKGKVAKVLRVLTKNSKVVVEGCKIAKKLLNLMMLTQMVDLLTKRCLSISLMLKK